MILMSWHVFVVFRIAGHISEAIHAYVMQALPRQRQCIFLVPQKGKQRCKYCSFHYYRDATIWALVILESLFYYFNSLPAVNIPIRKSPGSYPALIMIIQLTFLIFLFRWNIADLWERFIICFFFFCSSSPDVKSIFLISKVLILKAYFKVKILQSTWL